MPSSIRLYTQNDCPYCVIMKKKLDTWGYGYSEINVSENLQGKVFLKDRGHRTVPQLYHGETNLNAGVDTVNFERRHLEIMLLEATYENDGGVEMFG